MSVQLLLLLSGLEFFSRLSGAGASFPPGIFWEAVWGWLISAGLTPIRGQAAAGMAPQQNPAKPAA